MIDWYAVAVNSLWILGASIVLAGFSWLDWVARDTGTSRRQLFKQSLWRLPFYGGMELVSLGLGLGRGLAWWEHGVWGALAVWFGWALLRESRARMSGSTEFT